MSRISPQGYIYGKEPFSDNPFWSDDPLVQYDLTATASVDDTSGDPSVEVTRTETEDPRAVNFDFAFHGINGAPGETPEVTATATVGTGTGTPSVTVTRTGPDASPEFAFEFDGLKGEQGEPGPQGEPGQSVAVEGYIASYPQGDSIEDHSGDTTHIRIVDYRNDLTDKRAKGTVTVKDNLGNSYSQEFGIVPQGGSVGQFLSKVCAGDFLVEWKDIASVKKLTEYWNDTDKKLDLKDGDILFLNPNAGKKIYDARSQLSGDYGSYLARLSIDNESSDNPLSNAFTEGTIAGIYLNSAPLFLSGTGVSSLTIKSVSDTELASNGMRYHFNIPIQFRIASGDPDDPDDISGQTLTSLSIIGANMTCTASSDLTKIASLIICRLNIQVSLYAMMNITGLDELVYVMRIGG